MQEEFLSKIYFSATGTTKKCVESVASAMGFPFKRSLNLADRDTPEYVSFEENDIVVVGAPVYGGRIPSIVADKLSRMQGKGSRAIAIVVYGNRDYDDALLELTDILKSCGFKVMAAAAFIGQHSIFPKAGMSRPDRQDIDRLVEFGKACRESLLRDDDLDLQIKGNRPYKKYGGVPLHPTGIKDQCKKCGKCVELCPVDAIDIESPWLTDEDKCITCGRCIYSCSFGARKFKGAKYKITEKIFNAAFSKRKEPETFI